MIVSTSLAKVGQRQTPIQKPPLCTSTEGGFYVHGGKVVMAEIPAAPWSAMIEFASAGLPALQDGEPGQVRKEAATAVYCKCRGLGSPLSFLALVWGA